MNNVNPFSLQSLLNISFFSGSVKTETQNAAANRCRTGRLLCPEGLAVGTLVFGGVVLVGAHQNPVQGAVVFGVTVVGAGLNGAFDAFVGMAIHKLYPPFVWYGVSMTKSKKTTQEKSSIVAFYPGL